LEWVLPPSNEVVDQAKKILEKYFYKVTVR
jgi:hypothetical protein